MTLGTSGAASKLQAADKYPISIIIPAHNAAAHLGRCLEGVRANDEADVETIVVDDASSDSTPGIADDYGCRLVRLSRQLGPAGARNRGAREARHPYLLFLDSDVVLPSGSLGYIRDTLALYRHRTDVAGVLGQYSETAASAGFATNFKNLTTCYLYKATETQSPYLHTPIVCIRREVLEEAGGFDVRLWRAEDFRLGIVLGSRGYRFIIDRRIKGLHLKEYRIAGALKEDWLRIRDLRSVELGPGERAFALRAHRWNRLTALSLPGASLVCLGLAAIRWEFAAVAALLVAIFMLVNLRFLLFCRRRRGLIFAVGSAAFLFLEMLWAELALVASLLRPRIRTRNSAGSEAPGGG